MKKARFFVKQEPVKIIDSNGKVYVFICLNETHGTFINDTQDSTVSENYIEYDYNEFVIDKESVDIDDINNNPEKYLYYIPDSHIVDLTLDEYKIFRQEENKEALCEFLKNKTVTYKGKEYGVSEEDQNEMALNLTQYQVLTASGQSVSLEWHSKKAKCETFTQEEFVELIAMIKMYVYPYYQKMQNIKAAIFNSKNKFELSTIEIKYE